MPIEREVLSSADRMAFGANVRLERQLRRLSIEDLSRVAGVAKDTLFRIEHGRESTVRIRQKICAALQTTQDRLILVPADESSDIAVHHADSVPWAAFGYLPAYRPLPDEADRIQSAKERKRLGKIMFIRQFVQLLNCRLRPGRLVSGILELHADGIPGTYPQGEVFVYVLAGSVKVVVGNLETNLAQGEAATIRCGGPEFYFGPADAEPAQLLYVRLDE